jgi:hypothetical protein
MPTFQRIRFGAFISQNMLFLPISKMNLQVHIIIVDRCLDLEDITAADYMISHGRGSVHNNVEALNVTNTS